MEHDEDRSLSLGTEVSASVPPPSPLTGCYLLAVIGEPHTHEHKEIILQRLVKGLLSWDSSEHQVDLEKELAAITLQAPEGEEARYGERLIQYASENLVTEILIHPQMNTLMQCMRNLLSSFTRHRHLVHAGYTFAGNGSWIMQDGTFSLADFTDAYQENEVQRVIRAYENSISIDIHCSTSGGGEWAKLPEMPFVKHCKIRVNPTDILDSGSQSIKDFIGYLEPYVVPASLEQLLVSSDVVGNIRFSHPTLYVFPGGQGDAALFGINGFNMLVDGGFSRKACWWDFARHLDRLDAVLFTRLNNCSVSGMAAVLHRKALTNVYPQIGHFFCNLEERRSLTSPDGDKDSDPLLVSLLQEGSDMMADLRHLNLKPQHCYRSPEPINLYHKVGHGTLDMYVLNPSKDSKYVREFLKRWHSSEQKLFDGASATGPFNFPIPNIVSICALLVWRPANPDDTITRIMFPGSTPQHKIFEGLEKLKHLEFLQHPTCTGRQMATTNVMTTTTTVTSARTTKHTSIRTSKEKSIVVDKTKEERVVEPELPPKLKDEIDSKNIIDNKLLNELVDGEDKKIESILNEAITARVATDEKIAQYESTVIDGLPRKGDIKKKVSQKKVKRIDKTEDSKESMTKSSDNKKADLESKIKSDTRKKLENRPTVITATKTKTSNRVIQKISDKKIVSEKKITDDKRSPPTTPKKSVEIKSTTSIVQSNAKERPKPKPRKLSPDSTPAKSAKEANNRRVVESKYKQASPKRDLTQKSLEKKEIKTKREPISRRPRPLASPVKGLKAMKSPTKSVKSAKIDTSKIKGLQRVNYEDILKEAKKSDEDTSKSIDDIKQQELDDKEEQEIVREIEAVFNRDGETEEKIEFVGRSDIEKITCLLDETKTETTADGEFEEEYLIIEKEEIDQFTEDSIVDHETSQELEDELHKHIKDTEESEKKQNLITIEEKKNEKTSKPEKSFETDSKQEESKEHSVSVEEKQDISSEKKTSDSKSAVKAKDSLELNNVHESHPDEKISTTIESGATTAPTLPEDERITLDEIKEDQPEEEKHIKEDTKEIIPPQTLIDMQKPSSSEKSPKIERLPAPIREIVKTPDEVADLPLHEEVDYRTYEEKKTPIEEDLFKRKPELGFIHEIKVPKDLPLREVEAEVATKPIKTIQSDIIVKTVDRVSHPELVTVTPGSAPESPMFPEVKMASLTTKDLEPVREYEDPDYNYEQYTEKLRETHITTLDSPVKEDTKLNDEILCMPDKIPSIPEDVEKEIEEARILEIMDKPPPSPKDVEKIVADVAEVLKSEKSLDEIMAEKSPVRKQLSPENIIDVNAAESIVDATKMFISVESKLEMTTKHFEKSLALNEQHETNQKGISPIKSMTSEETSDVSDKTIISEDSKSIKERQEEISESNKVTPTKLLLSTADNKFDDKAEKRLSVTLDSAKTLEKLEEKIADLKKQEEHAIKTDSLPKVISHTESNDILVQKDLQNLDTISNNTIIDANKITGEPIKQEIYETYQFEESMQKDKHAENVEKYEPKEEKKSMMGSIFGKFDEKISKAKEYLSEKLEKKDTKLVTVSDTATKISATETKKDIVSQKEDILGKTPKTPDTSQDKTISPTIITEKSTSENISTEKKESLSETKLKQVLQETIPYSSDQKTDEVREDIPKSPVKIADLSSTHAKAKDLSILDESDNIKYDDTKEESVSKTDTAQSVVSPDQKELVTLSAKDISLGSVKFVTEEKVSPHTEDELHKSSEGLRDTSVSPTDLYENSTTSSKQISTAILQDRKESISETNLKQSLQEPIPEIHEVKEKSLAKVDGLSPTHTKADKSSILDESEKIKHDDIKDCDVLKTEIVQEKEMIFPQEDIIDEIPKFLETSQDSPTVSTKKSTLPSEKISTSILQDKKESLTETQLKQSQSESSEKKIQKEDLDKLPVKIDVFSPIHAKADDSSILDEPDKLKHHDKIDDPLPKTGTKESVASSDQKEIIILSKKDITPESSKLILEQKLSPHKDEEISTSPVRSQDRSVSPTVINEKLTTSNELLSTSSTQNLEESVSKTEIKQLIHETTIDKEKYDIKEETQQSQAADVTLTAAKPSEHSPSDEPDETKDEYIKDKSLSPVALDTDKSLSKTESTSLGLLPQQKQETTSLTTKDSSLESSKSISKQHLGPHSDDETSKSPTRRQDGSPIVITEKLSTSLVQDRKESVSETEIKSLINETVSDTSDKEKHVVKEKTSESPLEATDVTPTTTKPGKLLTSDIFDKTKHDDIRDLSPVAAVTGKILAETDSTSVVSATRQKEQFSKDASPELSKSITEQQPSPHIDDKIPTSPAKSHEDEGTSPTVLTEEITTSNELLSTALSQDRKESVSSIEIKQSIDDTISDISDQEKRDVKKDTSKLPLQATDGTLTAIKPSEHSHLDKPDETKDDDVKDKSLSPVALPIDKGVEKTETTLTSISPQKQEPISLTTKDSSPELSKSITEQKLSLHTDDKIPKSPSKGLDEGISPTVSTEKITTSNELLSTALSQDQKESVSSTEIKQSLDVTVSDISHQNKHDVKEETPKLQLQATDATPTAIKSSEHSPLDTTDETKDDDVKDKSLSPVVLHIDKGVGKIESTSIGISPQKQELISLTKKDSSPELLIKDQYLLSDPKDTDKVLAKPESTSLDLLPQKKQELTSIITKDINPELSKLITEVKLSPHTDDKTTKSPLGSQEGSVSPTVITEKLTTSSELSKERKESLSENEIKQSTHKTISEITDHREPEVKKDTSKSPFDTKDVSPTAIKPSDPSILHKSDKTKDDDIIIKDSSVSSTALEINEVASKIESTSRNLSSQSKHELTSLTSKETSDVELSKLIPEEKGSPHSDDETSKSPIKSHFGSVSPTVITETLMTSIESTSLSQERKESVVEKEIEQSIHEIGLVISDQEKHEVKNGIDKSTLKPKAVSPTFTKPREPSSLDKPGESKHDGIKDQSLSPVAQEIYEIVGKIESTSPSLSPLTKRELSSIPTMDVSPKSSKSIAEEKLSSRTDDEIIKSPTGSERSAGIVEKLTTSSELSTSQSQVRKEYISETEVKQSFQESISDITDQKKHDLGGSIPKSPVDTSIGTKDISSEILKSSEEKLSLHSDDGTPKSPARSHDESVIPTALAEKLTTASKQLSTSLPKELKESVTEKEIKQGNQEIVSKIDLERPKVKEDKSKLPQITSTTSKHISPESLKSITEGKQSPNTNDETAEKFTTSSKLSTSESQIRKEDTHKLSFEIKDVSPTPAKPIEQQFASKSPEQKEFIHEEETKASIHETITEITDQDSQEIKVGLSPTDITEKINTSRELLSTSLSQKRKESLSKEDFKLSIYETVSMTSDEDKQEVIESAPKSTLESKTVSQTLTKSSEPSPLDKPEETEHDGIKDHTLQPVSPEIDDISGKIEPKLPGLLPQSKQELKTLTTKDTSPELPKSITEEKVSLVTDDGTSKSLARSRDGSVSPTITTEKTTTSSESTSISQERKESMNDKEKTEITNQNIQELKEGVPKSPLEPKTSPTSPKPSEPHRITPMKNQDLPISLSQEWKESVSEREIKQSVHETFSVISDQVKDEIPKSPLEIIDVSPTDTKHSEQDSDKHDDTKYHSLSPAALEIREIASKTESTSSGLLPQPRQELKSLTSKDTSPELSKSITEDKGSQHSEDEISKSPVISQDGGASPTVICGKLAPSISTSLSQERQESVSKEEIKQSIHETASVISNQEKFEVIDVQPQSPSKTTDVSPTDMKSNVSTPSDKPGEIKHDDIKDHSLPTEALEIDKTADKTKSISPSLSPQPRQELTTAISPVSSKSVADEKLSPHTDENTPKSPARSQDKSFSPTDITEKRTSSELFTSLTQERKESASEKEIKQSIHETESMISGQEKYEVIDVKPKSPSKTKDVSPTDIKSSESLPSDKPGEIKYDDNTDHSLPTVALEIDETADETKSISPSLSPQPRQELTSLTSKDTSPELSKSITEEIVSPHTHDKTTDSSVKSQDEGISPTVPTEKLATSLSTSLTQERKESASEKEIKQSIHETASVIPDQEKCEVIDVKPKSPSKTKDFCPTDIKSSESSPSDKPGEIKHDDIKDHSLPPVSIEINEIARKTESTSSDLSPQPRQELTSLTSRDTSPELLKSNAKGKGSPRIDENKTESSARSQDGGLNPLAITEKSTTSDELLSSSLSQERKESVNEKQIKQSIPETFSVISNQEKYEVNDGTPKSPLETKDLKSKTESFVFFETQNGVSSHTTNNISPESTELPGSPEIIYDEELSPAKKYDAAESLPISPNRSEKIITSKELESTYQDEEKDVDEMEYDDAKKYSKILVDDSLNLITENEKLSKKVKTHKNIVGITEPLESKNQAVSVKTGENLISAKDKDIVCQISSSDDLSTEVSLEEKHSFESTEKVDKSKQGNEAPITVEQYKQIESPIPVNLTLHGDEKCAIKPSTDISSPQDSQISEGIDSGVHSILNDTDQLTHKSDTDSAAQLVESIHKAFSDESVQQGIKTDELDSLVVDSEFDGISTPPTVPVSPLPKTPVNFQDVKVSDGVQSEIVYDKSDGSEETITKTVHVGDDILTQKISTSTEKVPKSIKNLSELDESDLTNIMHTVGKIKTETDTVTKIIKEGENVVTQTITTVTTKEIISREDGTPQNIKTTIETTTLSKGSDGSTTTSKNTQTLLSECSSSLKSTSQMDMYSKDYVEKNNVESSKVEGILTIDDKNMDSNINSSFITEIDESDVEDAVINTDVSKKVIKENNIDVIETITTTTKKETIKMDENKKVVRTTVETHTVREYPDNSKDIKKNIEVKTEEIIVDPNADMEKILSSFAMCDEPEESVSTECQELEQDNVIIKRKIVTRISKTKYVNSSGNSRKLKTDTVVTTTDDYPDGSSQIKVESSSSLTDLDMHEVQIPELLDFTEVENKSVEVNEQKRNIVIDGITITQRIITTTTKEIFLHKNKTSKKMKTTIETVTETPMPNSVTEITKDVKVLVSDISAEKSSENIFEGYDEVGIPDEEVITNKETVSENGIAIDRKTTIITTKHIYHNKSLKIKRTKTIVKTIKEDEYPNGSVATKTSEETSILDECLDEIKLKQKSNLFASKERLEDQLDTNMEAALQKLIPDGDPEETETSRSVEITENDITILRTILTKVIKTKYSDNQGNKRKLKTVTTVTTKDRYPDGSECATVSENTSVCDIKDNIKEIDDLIGFTNVEDKSVDVDKKENLIYLDEKEVKQIITTTTTKEILSSPQSTKKKIKTTTEIVTETKSQDGVTNISKEVKVSVADYCTEPYNENLDGYTQIGEPEENTTVHTEEVNENNITIKRKTTVTTISQKYENVALKSSKIKTVVRTIIEDEYPDGTVITEKSEKVSLSDIFLKASQSYQDKLSTEETHIDDSAIVEDATEDSDIRQEIVQDGSITIKRTITTNTKKETLASNDANIKRVRTTVETITEDQYPDGSTETTKDVKITISEFQKTSDSNLQAALQGLKSTGRTKTETDKKINLLNDNGEKITQTISTYITKEELRNNDTNEIAVKTVTETITENEKEDGSIEKTKDVRTQVTYLPIGTNIDDWSPKEIEEIEKEPVETKPVLEQLPLTKKQEEIKKDIKVKKQRSPVGEISTETETHTNIIKEGDNEVVQTITVLTTKEVISPEKLKITVETTTVSKGSDGVTKTTKSTKTTISEFTEEYEEIIDTGSSEKSYSKLSSKTGDMRSSSAASDDLDHPGISSPPSDISSRDSRAATHVWGTESSGLYYSDDDGQVSPSSTKSQIAQSPKSNLSFELEPTKLSQHDTYEESAIPDALLHKDLMTTSVYGQLPEDDSCTSSSHSEVKTEVHSSDKTISKMTHEFLSRERHESEEVTTKKISDIAFLKEADEHFDKAIEEHKKVSGSEVISNITAKYELDKVTSSETMKSQNLITLKDVRTESKKQTESISESSSSSTKESTTEMTQVRESHSSNDPIESWGKPLGLPSPILPPNQSDGKGTPKKQANAAVLNKNKINQEKSKEAKNRESPSKKKSASPVYMELTYVPHHGNSYYSALEFFKRIRARYYVFSGTEPSKEIYNALLDAKKTWEDKNLEVTIIPTYDTDVLGYWVTENEEALEKYKIDLSPSASRCTINLQDHETSCAAYRLEF